jgi:hypothetical protein
MQFVYELPPKNNVRKVTPFFLYALLQPLFKILHCSSQHFFLQISDFEANGIFQFLDVAGFMYNFDLR